MLVCVSGLVVTSVSGCFSMAVYAQAYGRISSYLQTIVNKGVNPYPIKVKIVHVLKIN